MTEIQEPWNPNMPPGPPKRSEGFVGRVHRCKPPKYDEERMKQLWSNECIWVCRCGQKWRPESRAVFGSGVFFGGGYQGQVIKWTEYNGKVDPGP